MCVTIQCVCYQKMRNLKERKKESAYSVCVIAADEQSPSRGLQLSSGSMNATDQMYTPRASSICGHERHQVSLTARDPLECREILSQDTPLR